MSWSLMGISGLTGTVILFLNSQTIKQHTLYIFQMTNFKKIHDILMEHISFTYPEEVSGTFTCKKIFLPQPNIKSL